MIAAETASSITLRRAEKAEDTILRDQIEEDGVKRHAIAHAGGTGSAAEQAGRGGRDYLFARARHPKMTRATASFFRRRAACLHAPLAFELFQAREELQLGEPHELRRQTTIKFRSQVRQATRSRLQGREQLLFAPGPVPMASSTVLTGVALALPCDGNRSREG